MRGGGDRRGCSRYGVGPSPPPQAGSEVGCCSLCPSYGWARLNPQLRERGELEGLRWGRRSNGEECYDRPAAFLFVWFPLSHPRRAAVVLRASYGAKGAAVLVWQQLCWTCWDCSVLSWEMAHAPGQPGCGVSSCSLKGLFASRVFCLAAGEEGAVMGGCAWSRIRAAGRAVPREAPERKDVAVGIGACRRPWGLSSTGWVEGRRGGSPAGSAGPGGPAVSVSLLRCCAGL